MIIKGSVNQGVKEYSRLRIRKKYWDKFENIKRLTVKYKGDYFVTEINKLFESYGEVDNRKIKKWFGQEHKEVSIDITNLNNLNEMEIL